MSVYRTPCHQQPTEVTKSLLRPGEAVQGARKAGVSAQVDVQAALAWRDFMVSNHSDAGQERWLADRGIDLLRGTGRLAGTGVVEVEGVRRTAEHIVVATGADPVVPATRDCGSLKACGAPVRRRAGRLSRAACWCSVAGPPVSSSRRSCGLSW